MKFECQVTPDAIRRALSEALWEQCTKREAAEYMAPFCERRDEVRQGNDLELAAAFELLRCVCALPFCPGSDDAPLGPSSHEWCVSVGIFDGPELQALLHVVNEIADDELRARVADLLWITKRISKANYEMAVLAANAYVQSGKSILGGASQYKEVPAVDRFSRAVKLGLKLGGNIDAAGAARGAIQEAIEQNKRTASFALASMIELLRRLGADDAKYYAELCEALADSANAQNNYALAREFWQKAGAWWHTFGNGEAKLAAERQAAETYVGDADLALKRSTPSYGVAGSFIGQAIHALRQIPGNEARCEELHRVLIEYGKKAVGELMNFQSEPIDIKRIVDSASTKISGKNVLEAFRILALSVGFSDVAEMRKRAAEDQKKYLGRSLFPEVYLDAEGKVTDRRPASSAGSAEVDSRTLADMCREANLDRDLRVRGIVEPMRQVLEAEHHVELTDMLPLVLHNAFVPNGRERLYARGLLAGFHGEFDVAVSLLIPQLENSLRYLLAQRGVIVSGFDADGIQEDFNLNKLLTGRKQELERVLGADALFALRSLLVERPGPNLRNTSAHGLLPSQGYFSTSAIYAWWICLHFCVIGWMLMQQGGEEADAS